MNGRCALNNMNMRNLRRSQEYQCVIVDLAMLGIVSKEEAEMLLGAGVPMNLRLPNGKNNMISEESLTEDKTPTETDDTPPVTTGNTDDTGTSGNEETGVTDTETISPVTETNNETDNGNNSKEKKGFKLFGGNISGE